MAGKKPSPIDVRVGRNIRLQRLAAGLSQEELGREIGVTFQQVQKYEKGANRIGASRLTQVADALRIAVPVLFEGVASAADGGPVHSSPADLLTEPPALRLARAFADIPDDHLRSSIVELVERIAGRRG